eukprot:TRINITY_DN14818_c0_g1_i1.p1 TRINITY_DN14818_c0_g1~~TRINITY_DN14818_c0_g1_i1.p1  ORF type:complete len:221 (-),score=24.92 TRINITY_DN14818_c0_g1_i1:493-1155(-)
MDVPEEVMQKVYAWVDDIQLSRPKKNIARDFSDGVLMAEVLKHCFPKLVELHNYSAANSPPKKIYNWSTLNEKVFKKLGLSLSKEDIEAIANGVPGKVEQALFLVFNKVEQKRTEKALRQHQLQTHHHQPQYAPASAHDEPPFDRRVSEHLFPDGYRPAEEAVGQLALDNKDEAINRLVEHVRTLEEKICRLEQIVTLKEEKIASLTTKLQKATGSSSST